MAAFEERKEVWTRLATEGEENLNAENYQQAVVCFERCAEIARELGDKKREDVSYESAGKAYELMGLTNKSIECYIKCFKLALEAKDSDSKAEARDKLFDLILEETKKNKNVIENFEHDVTSTIIDEFSAEMLDLTGDLYSEVGLNNKAIQCYEKVLEFVLKKENTRGKLFMYNKLAQQFLRMGSFNKAIKFYQDIIKIPEFIGSGIEKDIYFVLGNDYQNLGQFRKALEYHNKSLQTCADDDMHGRLEAYSGLGGDYHSMGKYDMAVEYHKKSLKLALEVGHTEAEQAAYGNLGNSLKFLGQYDEAIEFHEKDLKISIKDGNKLGESSAYNNLGTVYLAQDKQHKAMEYFFKSLDISIEISDIFGEQLAYINIGSACEDPLEAIKYHEMALKLANAVGDLRGKGDAYINIGQRYQEIGEFQKANRAFEEGVSVIGEIGDKRGEGDGYMLYGLNYLRIHKKHSEKDLKAPCNCLETAAIRLNVAIECFEELFEELANDNDKISIVDTYQNAYKLLAMAYKDHRPQDALLACERARARALGELLNIRYGLAKTQKDAKETRSLTVQDVRKLMETCRFSVCFYALQPYSSIVYIWLSSSGNPTSLTYSNIEYCSDTQGDASTDASKGSSTNTKESASVKESTYTKEVSAETQALSMFTQAKNANVLCENKLTELVNSAHENMKVRAMANCEDRSATTLRNEEDAQQRVSTQKPIKDQLTRKVFLGDDDEEVPLEVLFEMLIEPISTKLVDDEIVFICEGALFTVPFPALKNPITGEYLSDTKRIRLAPSLTTLKFIEETPALHHCQSGALIVGNPKVGKVMFDGRVQCIVDLPGAQAEVEAIGKLLGVEPLIGNKATKARILQQLKIGVSVIHFAAHGTQDGQILLSPPPHDPKSTPEEKDYVLTLKEAQESGIRAQLVVLSCCHSGRGAIRSEGVIGMSRAFLAAGARAVVASLWALADDATNIFMAKFYAHLKSGKSTSSSLQQAMKEMRETEKYREPRYWAAFFVLGDDVVVQI